MVIKYFSFAPSIPFKIKSNGVIESKPVVDVWGSVLLNRNPIVFANSGLFETYCSLIFAELLNKRCPDKKILHNGNIKYQSLIVVNGLSTLLQNSLSQITSLLYPTSIFLDSSNFFYFNVLCNYLTLRSCNGTIIKKSRKTPLIQQIFNNTGLDKWNDELIPQLRKTINKEFLSWAKINKFDIKKPYVCIFPDSGNSIHKKIKCLNWKPSDIKSLAAILHQLGISTLVFSDYPNKYHNQFIFTHPVKYDTAVHLINKAKVVLSFEIDWLLIALISSAATIICGNYLTGPYELHRNAIFINKTDTKIYYDKELTPMKVLNLMENGYICEEAKDEQTR